MSLTKEQAIRRHRKMWKRIASETLRQKRQVFKMDYAEDFGLPPIKNNEWLCEYTQRQNGISPKCCAKHCPIKMNESNKPCMNDGAFSDWLDTELGDYKRAAELALAIANLPERREEDEV